MMWWILGGLAAFFLLLFIWCAGSYFYLKFHYRKRSELDRLIFSDLEKEERIPRSDSL
jgi:hypothetical protein